MSGRFVYWIAAILGLTAAYACWCGTPLIYDGAYQFAFTLIWQKPYVYLTRFHTLLLWQPLVWLSRETSSIKVLTFAYGMPFLLAPVVGLLGSWWVVRRHAPWLVLWAVFGIAAAPLPGQVFVINDSIFQQHLFWPVFLGFLVPTTWRQKLMIAVLVVFQFVHQIGLVLLGGTAGCVLILSLVGRDDAIYRRRMLLRTAVAAGLVFLMAFKIWLTSSPDRYLFGYHFGQWFDSYAAEEASWKVAKMRWVGGVKGAPIHGLCFMYAGAILIYLSARLRSSPQDDRQTWAAPLALLALGCVAVAGAIWIAWASDPSRWAWALEYRRWVVPLTLPFYALAFFEACRFTRAGGAPRLAGSRETTKYSPESEDDSPWQKRVALCYLLAAIFAAVLGLQSGEWALLTRRLMREVESDPAIIVPRWEMTWSNTSPLAHWATPCYVMMLQGKAPHKLLLETEADPRKLFASPPQVPLASFVNIPPDPGPAGWYDNRPLVESIRARMKPDDLTGRYTPPK